MTIFSSTTLILTTYWTPLVAHITRVNHRHFLHSFGGVFTLFSRQFHSTVCLLVRSALWCYCWFCVLLAPVAQTETVAVCEGCFALLTRTSAKMKVSWWNQSCIDIDVSLHHQSVQEIWANAHEMRHSISLISYADCLGLSPVHFSENSL